MRVVERLEWSGGERIASLGVPGDSGRKTALARALASFVEEASGAVFQVEERGVWPSSEHPPLYAALCKGFELPTEASVLRFGSSEVDELASFVAVALYFVWSFAIYYEDLGMIHFDDDEILDVYNHGSPQMEKLVLHLEAMLKP